MFGFHEKDVQNFKKWGQILSIGQLNLLYLKLVHLHLETGMITKSRILSISELKVLSLREVWHKNFGAQSKKKNILLVSFVKYFLIFEIHKHD